MRIIRSLGIGLGTITLALIGLYYSGYGAI